MRAKKLPTTMVKAARTASMMSNLMVPDGKNVEQSTLNEDVVAALVNKRREEGC